MNKLIAVAAMVALSACGGVSEEQQASAPDAGSSVGVAEQAIKTTANGIVGWGVFSDLGNTSCLAATGGTLQNKCKFADAVPQGDGETIRHVKICDNQVDSTSVAQIKSVVNRLNLDVGSKISAEYHNINGAGGAPICDGNEVIKFVNPGHITPQPAMGETRVAAYYKVTFGGCADMVSAPVPGKYQSCYTNTILVDWNYIQTRAPGGSAAYNNNAKQVVRHAVLSTLGIGENTGYSYATKFFNTSLQTDSRIVTATETCRINSLVGSYFFNDVAFSFSGNCP